MRFAAENHLVIERILLYDGTCGFCRRWCEWARRHGAEQTIRFEPCQSADEIRSRAGLSAIDCRRSAFLIEVAGDGEIRTRSGAAAINGVLAHLPGRRNAIWRFVSRLHRLPVVKQLEEIGYRIVARLRHHFSGRASCAKANPQTADRGH